MRLKGKTAVLPNVRSRRFRRLRDPAAVLLIAAALFGIVTGCTRSRSKAAAGEEGVVQLVYQDWRTDWFPPMAQEMLEEFHAAHPNIRVFYTPDPANFQERMEADFKAGTAPDVFQGCCTHFPIWAQKGYTLDLRPYVNLNVAKNL